jgi:hypothetical protein
MTSESFLITTDLVIWKQLYKILDNVLDSMLDRLLVNMLDIIQPYLFLFSKAITNKKID